MTMAKGEAVIFRTVLVVIKPIYEIITIEVVSFTLASTNESNTVHMPYHELTLAIPNTSV